MRALKRQWRSPRRRAGAAEPAARSTLQPDQRHPGPAHRPDPALRPVLSPSPILPAGRNLLNVIDQVTVLGILALGMTAVIIIGGIDLSVGAVLALPMMVLGWLSHDGGLPLSLAIVGALAAGAAVRRWSTALMTTVGQAARVHRHARHVLDRPRPGQHDHRRPADRRLPVVVHQPRLEPAASASSRPRSPCSSSCTSPAGRSCATAPDGRALYALGGSAEVARLAGLRPRA